MHDNDGVGRVREALQLLHSFEIRLKFSYSIHRCLLMIPAGADVLFPEPHDSKTLNMTVVINDCGHIHIGR
jgi:2-methylisocitrate lyase-like PEP mutase family enzyme